MYICGTHYKIKYRIMYIGWFSCGVTSAVACRMAVLEREVGHSCISGRFLDEMTEGEGRHDPPIVPDCGTFCEIEFADIIDPNVQPIMDGVKSMVQLKLF